MPTANSRSFLFFPVLRRGSVDVCLSIRLFCFYSSPSCDGDHIVENQYTTVDVSILPRLATGINIVENQYTTVDVSILPRLATGIGVAKTLCNPIMFLFFPVLRRGSYTF